MQKQNQKGVVFLEIILILAIIAIIGGIGYFWVQKEKIKKIENNITENNNQVATTTNTTTKKIGPKDCGTDFACFVSATQNCGQAKVLFTNSIDLFGIILKGTAFYEVKGLDESNKCVFYLQSKKADYEFPSGMSQEIIDQMKTTAKKTEGQYGTCLFKNSSDLTNLLNKWNAGSFSVSTDPTEGDFKDAKCSGPMFDTSNANANQKYEAGVYSVSRGEKKIDNLFKLQYEFMGKTGSNYILKIKSLVNESCAKEMYLPSENYYTCGKESYIIELNKDLLLNDNTISFNIEKTI